MNREEYLEKLATEPITPNQRGALMREFTRLGVHDRAERLAACAGLLDIDEPGSTAELTQGQAGQLVRTLECITDRAELRQAAALWNDDRRQPAGHPGQDDDEPGEISTAASIRVTWPEALTRFMVMIHQATTGSTGNGVPGSPESPENRT